MRWTCLRSTGPLRSLTPPRWLIPLGGDCRTRSKPRSPKLVYRRARFTELTLQEEVQDARRQAAWLEKKARLLEDLQGYEQALVELEAALKETPRHVQWKDLPQDDKGPS